MSGLAALALLSGFYPLAAAIAANRWTTLRSTLMWTVAALAVWVAAVSVPESLVLDYVALSLSGCAGVAVLGARRPGAGAWNFVVAGLLAVLLLPVATGLGSVRLETVHICFLAATLATAVLNFLPTRLGIASALAGVAFGTEGARVAGFRLDAEILTTARWLLALAPWLALMSLRWPRRASEVDRVWLDFRDRFGFLWAERMREQFNRASASAGRTQRLGWFGITTAGHSSADSLELLKVLLKRFDSRTYV
jgi:hypothetical protein